MSLKASQIRFEGSANTAHELLIDGDLCRGGSSKQIAAVRLVIGGALALAATFLIGSLLGSTVA